MRFYYRCIAVQSGNEYVHEFTPAQHPVFSDPKGFSMRNIERAMNELIDRWNKMMPDMWRYELIGALS